MGVAKEVIIRRPLTPLLYTLPLREDVDDEWGGVGGDDADGGVDTGVVRVGGGRGVDDRHDGEDGAEDLAGRSLSRCLREGERGWKGGNRKW